MTSRKFKDFLTPSSFCYAPVSLAQQSKSQWAVRKNNFFMLVLLRRTFFLTTIYRLYFSHKYTHITNCNLFHMLDLCGQLPCTASTPVFRTCGFSFMLVLLFSMCSWISNGPLALLCKYKALRNKVTSR